jgi:hypothetical protein
MKMSWRRLITYELFPFLARLLARLLAIWCSRQDLVEMVPMYRVRQYNMHCLIHDGTDVWVERRDEL